MPIRTAVIKVLCRTEELRESANLIAWAVGHRVEAPTPPPDAVTAWVFILTAIKYDKDFLNNRSKFGIDIVCKVPGVIYWEVSPSDSQDPEMVALRNSLAVDDLLHRLSAADRGNRRSPHLN